MEALSAAPTLLLPDGGVRKKSLFADVTEVEPWLLPNKSSDLYRSVIKTSTQFEERISS